MMRVIYNDSHLQKLALEVSFGRAPQHEVDTKVNNISFDLLLLSFYVKCESSSGHLANSHSRSGVRI